MLFRDRSLPVLLPNCQDNLRWESRAVIDRYEEAGSRVPDLEAARAGATFRRIINIQRGKSGRERPTMAFSYKQLTR